MQKSKGKIMNIFNWTPSALDKLKSLAKTHSVIQAADEIGCSTNQVRARIRRDGISYKKYGEHHRNSKRSNEDVRLVKELLAEGMPVRLICKKMEISQPEVSMIKNGKYRIHG